MNPRPLCLSACLLLLPMLPAGAESRTFRWGPDADTHIRMGGNETRSNFGGSGLMEVYQYGDTRAYISYVRFDLGILPVDAVIESVTLTFVYERGGTRTDTLNNDRFAVYGLLDRSGNTPQRWVENALTADTVGAEVVAPANLQFYTGYRVVSFDGINEVIRGNGQPGTSAGLGSSPELIRFLEDRLRSPDRLATFIVDIPAHTNDGRGYALATRENAIPAQMPQLEVTFRRFGAESGPRTGPGRE